MEESQNLEIKVKFTAPLPTEWHEWGNVHLAERAEEKALGWTPGTLAVLEEAFKLNLHRRLGWNVPKGRKAYMEAARFYKRGVYAGEALGVEASCDIEFHERYEPVYSDYVTISDSALNLNSGIKIGQIESQKNLAGAVGLASELKRAKGVILIGGGALCDLGGFVATVLGIPFVYVPTTLLAMIDACIGGKTGINFGAKNQIGAFSFPEKVIICSQWLATLSRPQFLSGASEALKHGFIAKDESFCRKLVQQIQYQEMNLTTLKELVEVKAAIVRRDPLEFGERAILNFGHTFGHAFETLLGISHGSAIATGMRIALHLSHRHLGLPKPSLQTMLELLGRSGCEQDRERIFSVIGTQWQEVARLLQSDKKNDGRDGINFSLLKDFGRYESPFTYALADVKADDLYYWLR